jgi:AcrR family transcriptional regulator
MDNRTRFLEAASTMLHASDDHDISTRAVSEAVGVGAPTLYRLFGDKHGLLAAVVDHALHGYLREKRAEPRSPDPSDDLYAAWDAHVRFALANPVVYRIACAPALNFVPPVAMRRGSCCSRGSPDARKPVSSAQHRMKQRKR